MIRLFAVVLRHDIDNVTEELLRQGVMQFIKVGGISSEESKSVADVSPPVPPAGLAEVRKRIEVILSEGGLVPVMPEEINLKERTKIDLDEEKRKIDAVAGGLQSIKEKKRATERELNELADIRQRVATYMRGVSPDTLSSKYSFISLKMGNVPSSNRPILESRLKPIPSVLLPIGEDASTGGMMLVYMKRDEDKIGAILTEAGWKDTGVAGRDMVLGEDAVADLEKKRERLLKSADALEKERVELIGKNKDALNAVWVHIRLHELYATIQSFFKETARTVIFTGWIPLEKRQSVERGIKEVTGDNCYLEWHSPSPGEEGLDTQHVPVQFRNPRFFSPFQMLVRNFGVPEYGTIDPTPFIMVTYLTMFALMFADVGQGAVVLLLGILAALFFRKKKQNLVDLAKLIIFCGAASIVGGVLFGSYFGIRLFKPVWFDFHGIVSGEPFGSSHIKDIFNILEISVYFGIVVITAGILFNWVNLLRQRQILKLFLDKSGIVGGWFFWGGVYVAGYMVKHGYREFPGAFLLFILVGLPALLMFLKAPLQHAHDGKKFTLMTPLTFLMEWVVELLELFSGYLSNTLSFMRVAGLGIAHASLMIAFFQIARMANGQNAGPPYTIWYFLVLLLGNVLVIGLEGLSAGIQALRLNYYEFFTKFFHGSGEAYSPISLKSR
jgi:V/A-type H+-transporting ATPase subunit I